MSGKNRSEDRASVDISTGQDGQGWAEKNVPFIIGISVFAVLGLLTTIMYFASN